MNERSVNSLIVIVAFSLFIAFAAGLASEEQAPAVDEADTAVAEISIDRLLNEFGPGCDNAEAFAEYGNKVFRFNGFVQSVEKDADGGHYLVVHRFSARPYFTHCYIEGMATDDLEELRGGGIVWFQGRCRGFSSKANALVFTECQIIPTPGTDPDIKNAAPHQGGGKGEGGGRG